MLSAWQGEFGDEYTARNIHAPSRVRLWADVLRRVDPHTVLEVGAGAGANLRAIKSLTDADVLGLEPNAFARSRLDEVCVAIDGAAQAIPVADGHVDFAFTSGVLIHIPPDELGVVCDEIHRVSSRYIACIEYFSPTPESKPYRGMVGLLHTRDFGGFYLDRFPDLQVVDYGFAWKRVTGLDDLTWQVFEKR